MKIYREVFDDSYTGYYTRSIQPRAGSDGNAAATTETLPSPQFEILEPKSALGGFIRDARAFGLPTRYVEAAVDRIRGVVFITFDVPTSSGLDADVVWASEPLTRKDIALISGALFEGLLSPDPRDAFAEDRFRTP